MEKMESNLKKERISTYVFLHVNTTCLPEHGECRVTEICLLAVHRQDLQTAEDTKKIPVTPRVTNKLVLCVKPDGNIYEKATEISELTNHSLSNQFGFSPQTVAVLQSFLRHIEKPICLIAHNGDKFDFAVLKAELVRAGQPDVFNTKKIFCADSLIALKSLDDLVTRNESSTPAKSPVKRKRSHDTDLDVNPRLKKTKTAPAVAKPQADEQTQRLKKAYSLPALSTTRQKSFALREYHKNEFGIDIRQSHTAEGFCKGLLTVALAKPGFFQWVHSNAKQFKDIKPAY